MTAESTNKSMKEGDRKPTLFVLESGYLQVLNQELEQSKAQEILTNISQNGKSKEYSGDMDLVVETKETVRRIS
jgi:hypothetical protein